MLFNSDNPRMTKKGLTPDKLRAANKLRSIWETWKSNPHNYPQTQSELADMAPPEWGWNQSVVSQHLTGRRSFNLLAVHFYADVLKITDIFEIANDAVVKQIHQARNVQNDITSDALQTVRYIRYPDKSFNNQQDVVSVPKALIESEGVSPPDCIAFEMFGDSVSGLKSGSGVIARTDRLSEHLDGTYLINYLGQIAVKRLTFDGQLCIAQSDSVDPLIVKTDDVEIRAEVFGYYGSIR